MGREIELVARREAIDTIDAKSSCRGKRTSFMLVGMQSEHPLRKAAQFLGKLNVCVSEEPWPAIRRTRGAYSIVRAELIAKIDLSLFYFLLLSLFLSFPPCFFFSVLSRATLIAAERHGKILG